MQDSHIPYYYNNKQLIKQTQTKFSSVHTSFDFNKLVVIDVIFDFFSKFEYEFTVSIVVPLYLFCKCFILVFAFFGSPYTFNCYYVIFGYLFMEL